MAERWAVVTGASRGIGAAIARRLSADGYGVALVGRDRAALEALATDCGPRRVHVADLGDRAQRSALAAELRAAPPGVDVLVNNAGIAFLGAVQAQGAAWDEMFEINLRAPFELLRELEPALRRRGRARRWST